MRRKSKNSVLVQNYPFGQAAEIENKLKTRDQRSQQHKLEKLKAQNNQKQIEQSQEHNFGPNYNDPYALEKLIDSFFYKNEIIQTQKPDPKSKNFQAAQEAQISKFFDLKVEDNQDNFDKNNIPRKNKFGKVSIHCPAHTKHHPHYYCIEPDCKAPYRVCCKDCIVEGPHKLHKNEPIEYVEKQVENMKIPMKKTFLKFKNIVKEVQEPFDQLKSLFNNAMNLIQEHYLKELQPELKKLFNIKEFLELTGDNFQVCQKYKNQNVNNLVHKIMGDNREEFMKTLRPDREKIDLFMRFTDERTGKLKDYSKEFLKHLLPTFLQEINYNRLLVWEQDQIKQKKEEKENYYREHGIPLDKEAEYREQKKKKQVSHELQTNLKGEITNVFQKHLKAVNDLSSISNNYAISCSQDSTMHLMDLEQNIIYKNIELNAGPVTCMEKLSDKYVISSHSDRSLRVIDVMNGIQVEKIDIEEDTIQCLHRFNDNYVIYGTNNGNIGFLNYKNMTIDKFHINAHSSRINCISKINELEFASGANDGNIYIWDFKSKEKVAELLGHEDAVLNIVCMDKNNMISNSYDKQIIHWNIKDYKLETEYYSYDYSEILDDIDAPEHVDIEWKMCRINDSLIASAGEDNCVKVWNFRTGKVLKYLQGHKGSIYALAVSKQGDQIISADKYAQIIFWK